MLLERLFGIVGFVIDGGFGPTDHGGDLRLLEEAIDTVLSAPLSCLSAIDLAQRACFLERLGTRLEAAKTAALAAADSAAEAPATFKALGYRHVIDYVADNARADARDVRRLSKIGMWLLDFAVFTEAFATGHLSRRHIKELMALDKPNTRHHLVESQEMLVEAAQACDFPDFVNVCAYWLNAADPDGEEPAETAAKSGLTYKKHSDGSVSGRFWFDPLIGQAFRQLLDDESQRLFRRDAEESVSRSVGGRNGAALVNLMVRGAKSGGNSQITPLINLVIGQELADNMLARLLGDTNEVVEPSFTDINRRCELIDGTPIHPRLAMVAFAVARFHRMVFESPSKIVDIASDARCFPSWMRLALLVTARGRCQIPGCDAPFPWLQADHVRPHSKGGPTALSNGQILCDPHNKWKRDDIL